MNLDANTLLQGGGLLVFAFFVYKQQVKIADAITKMAEAMALTAERQKIISHRQDSLHTDMSRQGFPPRDLPELPRPQERAPTNNSAKAVP